MPTHASPRRPRGLPALALPMLPLLLALALLAGCAPPTLPWSQSGASTTLPDSQQVLRLSVAAPREGFSAFETDLDPNNQARLTPSQIQLLSLLYSGLLTFSANLRPVPALADHYSVSADGLRYTFHIRAGARFSDGAPLTSADAAFSLNRIANACGGYYNWAFLSLKDAVHDMTLPSACAQTSSTPVPASTFVGDALLTPDPSTLVIALDRPDGALLSKLAEPFSGVVEQALVTRYSQQGGEGWTEHLAEGGGQGTSGMYSIAFMQTLGGVIANNRITLRRATGYWGPRPLLRELDVTFTTNSSVTPLVPAREDVSLDVSLLPADQLSQVAKLPGYHMAPARTTRYLTLATSALAAGAERPSTPTALDDARLRKALALALDKPRLASMVVASATGAITPAGMLAASVGQSGVVTGAPLTGDLAQAQALWRSYVAARCGGVAARCPKISLYANNNQLNDPVDAAMIQQWEEALPGLQAQVAAYEGGLLIPPSFIGDVVDITITEDYPDPQDWLSGFASDPRFPYIAPITTDAQANALIQRAEATLDPATRLALYAQAQAALINDGLVIPLAQGQTAWAQAARVRGFPTGAPQPYIPPAAWARIVLGR